MKTAIKSERDLVPGMRIDLFESGLLVPVPDASPHPAAGRDTVPFCKIVDHLPKRALGDNCFSPLMRTPQM